MIFASSFGADDSPVATPAAPASGLVTPSAATRTPFTRPVQATSNFVPRSLDTGFIPEFEPFPLVMLPQMPRLPRGMHNPLASEPQSGGVPTAGTLPADPSGQSSVPAGVPSPVKMHAGRMMPPGLIMALGIMPSISGVRGGHVNPTTLVARGRKPGAV
jgi:hypothetical protein